MAYLKETSTWETGIYQWETSDPVLGGVDGIDNVPTRQLANRTLWLKTQIATAVESITANKLWAVDELTKKADKTTTLTAGNGLTGGGTLAANRTLTLGPPGTITAGSTNSVQATGHTHAIDSATTSRAGIVQLANTLASTATDQALTAAQGKALNDNKLGNTGAQTLTGTLEISGVNSSWPRLYMPVKDGGVWRFEVNPNSETDSRFNFVYTSNDETQKYMSFPTLDKSETIAYQSWVSTELAKKANNTIVLTAGNGLTGGGTLAANRTLTLGPPGTITASSTNSVQATGHTHAIDSATTSRAGIVQLANTLASTATDQALTAAQGKALNDNKANKATTRSGYGITDASQVAVLTGTISDGGTLPLPSGYSVSQCKFIVSVARDNPNDTSWDIDENGGEMHYTYNCYLTGRVVTCKTYLNKGRTTGGDGTNQQIVSGVANYMVIGVK